MKTPYITRQQAQHEQKELEAEVRNSDGVLRKHYEKKLQQARRLLRTMKGNDSFYVAPRTPFSKLPKTRWEELS